MTSGPRGRSWAERHEAHRLSNVESQHTLARVAVGLNFVHKTLPDAQRFLAFLYAAAALKSQRRLAQHGKTLALVDVS